MESDFELVSNTPIWTDDGRTFRGKIVYNSNGPRIVLDSGKEFDGSAFSVTYEIKSEIIIDNDGRTVLRQLPNAERVSFEPICRVSRPYLSTARERPGEIYPPSSHGWYGRMVEGKKEAVYFVQKVVNEDLYWLTIVDSSESHIAESHSIQPYETKILTLKDGWDQFNDAQRALGYYAQEEIRSKILSILDEPSLTWDEIYSLAGDMSLPLIIQGATTRDTLNNLVPSFAFDTDIRDEVLAFLAWVGKKRIPLDNLVDFFESLGSVPTFRALAIDHIKLLIDNRPIPSYIRLVNEAVDGSIRRDKSIEEVQSKKPHVLLRYRLYELAPDWRADAVIIAKELEGDRALTLVPPQPGKSMRSQRRRFQMSTLGFTLRGYLRPLSVGLRNLVYIGAAHRWAHLHLAYSLSLQTDSGTPLHLQSILVPPLAAERIKAILPRAVDISWSGSSINLGLYHRNSRRWTMRTEKILDAAAKKASLRVLRRTFGDWKGTIPHHLTPKEAQIIDMVNSTAFYLTHLQSDRGKKYWKTTAEEAKRVLTSLRDNGIVNISYRFSMSGNLVPAAVIIEGSEESVYSITKALLEECPTTRALIASDGRLSICSSRIPREETKSLFSNLPRIAGKYGITVRPLTIITHRNYEGSICQRILNPDGSYNDDTSGFLSQVRSAPKSLLEDTQEEEQL